MQPADKFKAPEPLKLTAAEIVAVLNDVYSSVPFQRLAEGEIDELARLDAAKRANRLETPHEL